MIPDTKEGRWSSMAALIAGYGGGAITLLAWLGVTLSGALGDIARALGVVGVVAILLLAYSYFKR